MTTWTETAALVLAKCASNDPWFPNPGQAIVKAWAEIFATSNLTREDLLAGVTRAYQTEDTGYRPLPASIVKHARASYFESLANLPDERRESMEDAAHALMEIGIQPPDAHKYVRRIILGRTPLPAHRRTRHRVPRDPHRTTSHQSAPTKTTRRQPSIPPSDPHQGR